MTVNKNKNKSAKAEIDTEFNYFIDNDNNSNICRLTKLHIINDNDYFLSFLNKEYGEDADGLLRSYLQ